MSAGSRTSAPHRSATWPDEVARRYRALGYWTGDTLHAHLERAAARHPDRLALVCGGRRWTHAGLQARIRAATAGLRAAGIAAGDRVIVQLPNIAEFIVVSFALFRIGAVPIFAQVAHRRAEIAQFVERGDASAWIAVDRHAGFDHRTLAREVLALRTTMRTVVIVGDAAEFASFDALCATPGDDAAAPADAGAIALLQLSGGSTGIPKLIPRTHDDYLYSIRESARICAIDERSVYLCALPASHNFAMSSPGSFGVLGTGGCGVMTRSADPATAFALIEREREAQKRGAFEALNDDSDPVRALGNFGLCLVRMINGEFAVSAHRVVIGVAERMPDLGRGFYENGPMLGAGLISRYLDRMVAEGKLVIADTNLAAVQFIDLCQSTLTRPRLFNAVRTPPSEAEIRHVVGEAIAMFMARYGVRPRD